MKAAVLKWQKQVDPFAGHGQLQEEHPSSKIGHRQLQTLFTLRRIKRNSYSCFSM